MEGSNVYYAKASRGIQKPWIIEGKPPGASTAVPFKLYGAKLTGILVQSFCRELFFSGLLNLKDALSEHTIRFAGERAFIVGQFHDEVVVEYAPRGRDMSLPFKPCSAELLFGIKVEMVEPGVKLGIPMQGEPKAAHRYIK